MRLDLRELKSLYNQGRLVPFIGAGISRGVVWSANGKQVTGPLWEEVVNRAAEELGYLSADLLRVRGTDLQILEYYKLKKDTLAPLVNWLSKRLDPPDEAILESRVHQMLAALSKVSLVYTTNYDQYLERAFELHGRQVHVVALEKDIGRAGGRVEIVKFHGDFNHPDRMVITESDYGDRMRFAKPLDFRFRADLLGRAVLFLGYSFRDPNVSYLFRLVKDDLGNLPDSASGRRAYIIIPDPSDFEYRLFQSRNIEVLAVSSEKTADDICEILSELEA